MSSDYFPCILLLSAAVMLYLRVTFHLSLLRQQPAQLLGVACSSFIHANCRTDFTAGSSLASPALTWIDTGLNEAHIGASFWTLEI